MHFTDEERLSKIAAARGRMLKMIADRGRKQDRAAHGPHESRFRAASP